MFNKLLVIIDFSEESEIYFQKVIEFARHFDAEVIAFNIVDINIINLIAKHSGRRESEVAVDLEENGWKYLYMFEDLAKEKGVKTVVHQEEGIFESAIIEGVSKYKADLLCLRKNIDLGAQSGVKVLERILEKIHSPVILF